MFGIENYFFEKEKTLEKVYAESKLQHSPDEAKIKKLLLDCLEVLTSEFVEFGFVPRGSQI